jgi:hypothetical protein
MHLWRAATTLLSDFACFSRVEKQVSLESERPEYDIKTPSLLYGNYLKLRSHIPQLPTSHPAIMFVLDHPYVMAVSGSATALSVASLMGSVKSPLSLVASPAGTCLFGSLIASVCCTSAMDVCFWQDVPASSIFRLAWSVPFAAYGSDLCLNAVDHSARWSKPLHASMHNMRRMIHYAATSYGGFLYLQDAVAPQKSMDGYNGDDRGQWGLQRLQALCLGVYALVNVGRQIMAPLEMKVTSAHSPNLGQLPFSVILDCVLAVYGLSIATDAVVKLMPTGSQPEGEEEEKEETDKEASRTMQSLSFWRAGGQVCLWLLGSTLSAISLSMLLPPMSLVSFCVAPLPVMTILITLSVISLSVVLHDMRWHSSQRTAPSQVGHSRSWWPIRMRMTVTERKTLTLLLTLHGVASLVVMGLGYFVLGRQWRQPWALLPWMDGWSLLRAVGGLICGVASQFLLQAMIAHALAASSMSKSILSWSILWRAVGCGCLLQCSLLMLAPSMAMSLMPLSLLVVYAALGACTLRPKTSPLWQWAFYGSGFCILGKVSLTVVLEQFLGPWMRGSSFGGLLVQWTEQLLVPLIDWSASVTENATYFLAALHFIGSYSFPHIEQDGFSLLPTVLTWIATHLLLMGVLGGIEDGMDVLRLILQGMGMGMEMGGQSVEGAGDNVSGSGAMGVRVLMQPLAASLLGTDIMSLARLGRYWAGAFLCVLSFHSAREAVALAVTWWEGTLQPLLLVESMSEAFLSAWAAWLAGMILNSVTLKVGGSIGIGRLSALAMTVTERSLEVVEVGIAHPGGVLVFIAAQFVVTSLVFWWLSDVN